MEKIVISIKQFNNITLILSASFSSKTYLMFKNSSRIGDRFIYINAKSLLEEYCEISSTVKSSSQFDSRVVVFDDVIGSKNFQ